MSVLARPYSPAAIFDWCELLPKTFDLIGFLPFSASSNLNGNSTPHGVDGFFNHLYSYEPYIRELCLLQQNILDMTDL